MKPIWLAITVAAAIAGGGAGGVIATKVMAPAQRNSEPVATAAKPLDDKPVGESRNYDNELAELRNDIKTLNVKLSDAVTAANDSKASLATATADYNKRIAALESRPAGTVANSGGGTSPAPVDESSPEFAAAVEKVLADRDEQRRKEREAEQQKWMEDRWVQENTTIATTLTEKLALTPEQVAKVNTVLEGYTNSRRDLMERGRAAMESGTEFDWRAEGTKLSTEVTEQIRGELSSAQLSTFNELVGDQGISALQPRGFGGRGPGGQGGGRQGGGGRGN